MKPSMELPLVLFTLLSQTGIGLVLLSGARRFGTAGASDAQGAQGAAGSPSADADRRQWIAAAALLALGLAFSLLHLGHPFESFMALKHLSTSWLSREALTFAALTALIAFTALRGLPGMLVRLSVAVALLGLFIQGMTYAPPSFPALHNGLPFAMFLLSSLVLGAGAASLIAPATARPGLARVLAWGLGAALFVHLLAPSIWLSGGAVARMTGEAYFASPLYWTHIVVGLALPLCVVLKKHDVPSWLPWVLAAGALCGRIAFYLDTVHTAVNLGALY